MLLCHVNVQAAFMNLIREKKTTSQQDMSEHKKRIYGINNNNYSCRVVFLDVVLYKASPNYRLGHATMLYTKEVLQINF